MACRWRSPGGKKADYLLAILAESKSSVKITQHCCCCDSVRSGANLHFNLASHTLLPKHYRAPPYVSASAGILFCTPFPLPSTSWSSFRAHLHGLLLQEASRSHCLPQRNPALPAQSSLPLRQSLNWASGGKEAGFLPATPTVSYVRKCRILSHSGVVAVLMY